MGKKIQEENFWKYYLDPEKEDKESATEFLEKAGIEVEEEKGKLVNRINEKAEEVTFEKEKEVICKC